MRASLTRIGELTGRDIGAWRALCERAPEPNPFFAPDFMTAAADAFASDDPALLVAEADGEWLACLPVARAGRWRGVPLPGLVTWRHPYCLLGTPLLDPAGGDAALGALVGRARAEERTAFLVLEWVGADGPVSAALERVVGDGRAPTLRYERFERAALRRRPEPTYLEGLSTKRAKELRRQRRALERELEAELEVVDRAGDPRAVEKFMALEASGWKGRAGTAILSAPRHARFLREMAAAFAAAGRLQLLSLEAAGRPLAMQCNLLAGDAVFCFKVAYDEEFARYAAGVQLELEAVDVFHERTPAAWMDSCAEPDNELINRLWPDRRALRTLVVPADGPLGRATRPAIGGMRALRRGRDGLRRVRAGAARR